MAGAVLEADSVRDARQALRTLLLPGQERIHFSSESDARRREALKMIVNLSGATVIIHSPAHLPEREARRLCVSKLAECVPGLGVSHVCLELNDSQQQLDRDILFGQRRLGVSAQLINYRWLRASQESLLWVADGFAWAFTRGGSWQRLLTDQLALHVV